MKIIKWFFVIISFFIFIGWGKSDLQEGKDYFRAGQAAKAIDSFTKAIQLNPKEQEAYFFRGATFSAIGQFDPAIEDYMKVIQLNPQHEEAYWSRGYCYQNKRMDDKAITDYTESLRLGTKMKALVYELRAGAYYRKSMLREAEEDLKFVLQLKPGDQKALKGLEDIRKAKSDPSFDPQALKFRPIDEQPQYGEAPLTAEVQKANDQFVQEVIQAYKSKELALEGGLKWAWKLYEQADYSTSMKRFNEAWLLDRNNPEVFYGYSLILRSWGYNNEADKWEKKAKDSGYQGNAQGQPK